MAELTTPATFVGGHYDEALTTIVARSVLEAALVEDDTARLWFEVESEGGDSRRLDVELTPGDLEEILALAGSDDVALSLDGDYVAGLFDDVEVEAHGLRGAIAIAVTGAALLAPAAQAGLPQAVGVASATQQATAQQATGQRAGAAATAQVSSLAAKTQVTLQRKAQVSKAQAAKVSGFKLLRSGLVR